MIATIDKFANVPWRPPAPFSATLSAMTRSAPGGGIEAADLPLPKRIAPDRPHHQDELHLISGPLRRRWSRQGRLRALLASRLINGERRGPKIVASTATVRRAGLQIAIFWSRHNGDFPRPASSAPTPSSLKLIKAHHDCGSAWPRRGADQKLVFLRALQTLLAGSSTLVRRQRRSCRSLPDDALLFQCAARTRALKWRSIVRQDRIVLAARQVQWLLMSAMRGGRRVSIRALQNIVGR